jgi:transcription factor MYB, plant
VWHTHLKKRLRDADSGGRRRKQARKNETPAKHAVADVDRDAPSQFTAASPGLSSSVSSGVTCSTATESTAAATTSANQVAVKAEETESFSTAEFPPIDDSFWASADVMDMDLGALDEELGLASSASTRDEDMEFWKMLLESGDMRDLSVM